MKDDGYNGPAFMVEGKNNYIENPIAERMMSVYDFNEHVNLDTDFGFVVSDEWTFFNYPVERHGIEVISLFRMNRNDERDIAFWVSDVSVVAPDTNNKSNVRTVGEWIYFIYPLEYSHMISYGLRYSSLFRLNSNGEDGLAVRVNSGAIRNFDVARNSVFYLRYGSAFFPFAGNSQYVTRPDGLSYMLLVGNLADFKIDGDQIYFTYMPSGSGGRRTLVSCYLLHAIFRMDLDGSNISVAAFKPAGIGIGASGLILNTLEHVEDGWAYGGDREFRIRLGNPADGSEAVQLLNPDYFEGDWIYWIAHSRIMKARPDGTELTEIFYKTGLVGIVLGVGNSICSNYQYAYVNDDYGGMYIYFNTNWLGGGLPLSLYRVSIDGTDLSWVSGFNMNISSCNCEMHLLLKN